MGAAVRYALIAFLLLALPACSPKTVRVEVPVSVPCLGPAPDKPTYKFGEGDYPGESAASRVLLSDLNAAKAYAAGLITQMAGCR